MVIYANKVFQPRAVCNQIASLRSKTNKKRVLLRVPLTRNVPAINEVTVLSSFGIKHKWHWFLLCNSSPKNDAYNAAALSTSSMQKNAICILKWRLQQIHADN
ncbi:hypothetical protein Tsp_10109 [Trichinella spiralis]|uniref:hypothetical protein n=1 Tax=Trichinella spiralis TaxID=6334 RepID=UPI0001EFB381|nr:hypothetical protein Tsp_10109 [Trichinella spiralis]